MVIHVYHPYRQPDAPNHCLPLNGRCSHICLPAPQITANSAKTACACPHGLKLDKDSLNCVHDRKFDINRNNSFSLFIFSFPYVYSLASYVHSVSHKPTDGFAGNSAFNNVFSHEDFDREHELEHADYVDECKFCFNIF